MSEQDFDKRVCRTCKGDKVTRLEGFTALDGTVYAASERKCYACNGEGIFPKVDVDGIRQLLLASKGKNKGKLRAAMTSPVYTQPINEKRAYYVWRLARFHGGKDPRMPMMADLTSRGDPFKKDLDLMADAMAKESFGTDMAAAIRWGRALGAL